MKCKNKKLNLFGKCTYFKKNGACKKPDELMCIELTDEEIWKLPKKINKS